MKTIKSWVSFFKGLVEESKGVYSSLRFSMLVIVFTVMTNWTIDCFRQKRIVDIPTNVIAIVGITFTAKVGQSFSENSSTPSSSTTIVTGSPDHH